MCEGGGCVDWFYVKMERVIWRMEDGGTVELISMRLSRGEAHLHTIVLVGRDISAITPQDVLFGTHADSV